MKHYELVLLITPNQSEQVSGMIARYKETIESEGGKVHRAEDWGRHQLAYLIDGVHKAHYILMNVEVSQDSLDKLTTGFKFNDAILRNLVISKSSAETEPSAMKKKVEADDAAQANRASKSSNKTESATTTTDDKGES